MVTLYDLIRVLILILGNNLFVTCFVFYFFNLLITCPCLYFFLNLFIKLKHCFNHFKPITTEFQRSQNKPRASDTFLEELDNGSLWFSRILNQHNMPQLPSFENDATMFTISHALGYQICNLLTEIQSSICWLLRMLSLSAIKLHNFRNKYSMTQEFQFILRNSRDSLKNKKNGKIVFHSNLLIHYEPS